MTKLLFIPAWLYCVVLPSSTQNNTNEKKADIHNGGTLRYHVMTPLAAQTSAREKYSFLIFRHNSGECRTNNLHQMTKTLLSNNYGYTLAIGTQAARMGTCNKLKVSELKKDNNI